MHQCTVTPSSRGKMEEILEPIIDLIHTNKIHSYHQLKYQKDAQFSLAFTRKNKNIFERKPKTALDVYNPQGVQKVGGNLSSKTARVTSNVNVLFQRIQNPNGSLASRSNLSQNSNIQRRQRHSNIKSETKGKYRNSKIKRHLIEAIDFDEIQKMLFKKKDHVTRYEYYLLKYEIKKKMSLKNNTKLTEQMNKYRFTRNKTNKSAPHSLKDQFDEQYPAQSIKSPPRKKFWIKQTPKRTINHDSDTMISGKTYQTLYL